MKRVFSLILGLCLLLCGCGAGDKAETTQGTFQGGSVDTTEQTSGDSGTASDATVPEEVSDMFTDRDYRTTYEDKVASVTLSGDTASSDTDAVQISGSTVTITDEGTYVLSGSLEGMVIVNAEQNDKLQLVLDNVTVNSASSAALYILQADKVFLTLPEGTENSLSSGESFVAIDENNIDAAIFSKDDLTINGTGSLNVSSPAGHGITVKDDLVMTGGNVSVTSASHGLQANDSVRLANTQLTVAAGKDGIHAENDEDGTLGFVYLENGSYTISAEGDGISAGAYLQILDGTYDIITGGGSVNGQKAVSDNYGGFGGGMGGFGGGMGGGGRGSMQNTSSTSSDSGESIKALKAAGELSISGGSFTIDCADDAVHSNTSLTVAGGTFEIATGDDGFHADEKLVISNGTVNITESYEGLEGLDITVSGGNITMVCSDDGINAAGGNDSSGFGGNRGDTFGGGRGGMGGMGSGMGGSSNGSILISGGTVYMNASGDGIDANGSFTMSGGQLTVCGPTQGDTAVLDYDNTATITGGTFIGTGSYMMAQTFSSSEQGVISLSVGNQSAGAKILLTDSDGNTLFDVEPKLSYAIVILSCPEMVSGESYTVSIGDYTDTFEAS